MRGFIILCLVAFAYGDKLGYNYHPVDHSSSGLSFAPGGGSSGFSGGSDGGDGGFDSGAASYNAPVTEELHKEYYSFSAPEEEFDDAQGAQQLANSVKKNLRVIFIKGPENNGLEKAALNLARQAAEQRTAIYVLQKQHDLNDFANKFRAAHSTHNAKPEVHFVKYRTPQDAANAQHSIQQQYDSLGGTTQSHNGGVAPVLNYASPSQTHYSHGGNGGSVGHIGGGGVGSFGGGSTGGFGGSTGGFGGGSSGSFGSGSSPSVNYLPPSLLKYIRY